MKILIIGASGLVGGNIYDHLSNQAGWEITGTYHHYAVENLLPFNAADKAAWSPAITGTPWDVIIHTGALTHVDKCEEEPQLSETGTVLSAANICALAAAQNARLIYISTDYIFDGRSGPYCEDDIPAPLNVYGGHKLKAEELVRSAINGHLILRITNVYGKELRGKNYLARVIGQLRSGESPEITAPYDQYATPVNAADIARAVGLLINDKKSGTYHLASTDLLSRVQLLQRVNVYFDNKLTIHPVDTAFLKQLAKRPLRGGLSAAKFLSEYPGFRFSNIDDYLKEQHEL